MGASQPLGWAGAVYLICPTLEIISFSNSCSHGGQQSRETHSCPFRSPHTVSRPTRSGIGTSSPQTPFLMSCSAQFANFLFFFFFFLASTTSIWRKRDAAPPHELCLFRCSQLAKPEGNGKNTQHFQIIFCILNIQHKCISPWPAHQVCEMLSSTSCS